MKRSGGDGTRRLRRCATSCTNTAALPQNLAEGMSVVKIGLAYMRDLRFQEVGKADAERDFEALMRAERPAPQGFRTAFVRLFRRLEDYMFHHVMILADAHHVPVQIHTG